MWNTCLYSWNNEEIWLQNAKLSILKNNINSLKIRKNPQKPKNLQVHSTSTEDHQISFSAHRKLYIQIMKNL